MSKRTRVPRRPGFQINFNDGCIIFGVLNLSVTSYVTAYFALTYLCRVDPEGTTDQNRQAPEILAWKNHHLRVLVELNKFMELQPCIMESSLGKQVLRGEERAWRKEMEEKQESCHQEMVALLNQIISLHTRDSVKAEEGIVNNANLFNLPVFVSAAFAFGFLACWLFTTNFH